MSEAQAQTQTQTQTQAVVPAPVVAADNFGAFSLTVTALLILAIFCVVYFALRRRPGPPRHLDDKAGDEGED